jgi:hypothetical protein
VATPCLEFYGVRAVPPDAGAIDLGCARSLVRGVGKVGVPTRAGANVASGATRARPCLSARCLLAQLNRR